VLRITWRESGKVRERKKRGEREERESEKDRGYACDMKEREKQWRKGGMESV
jgi:hypothetical protein